MLPEMTRNGHRQNQKSGDFVLNFSNEFGILSDEKLSFMASSDL
jgi:hypothetical protein